MDVQVRHESHKNRFVANVEGGEAVLKYRRGPGNSYDLLSTNAPEEARGQNVGDKLVRAALQVAKDENVQVIGTCPYVRHWFEKHPEERAILWKGDEPQMEAFY